MFCAGSLRLAAAGDVAHALLWPQRPTCVDRGGCTNLGACAPLCVVQQPAYRSTKIAHVVLSVDADSLRKRRCASAATCDNCAITRARICGCDNCAIIRAFVCGLRSTSAGKKKAPLLKYSGFSATLRSITSVAFLMRSRLPLHARFRLVSASSDLWW
eukprot:CAMPEP_0176338424 /NCGR_PEP_ID=MMETSP0121_2-20121125/80130_1 /TAXON_ID=160619 /ORGANISM="Kryptoperidinium foliaceum, Strain CCMP 1326" /LENGTH=157 /DNA_ID=CAMNT_0017681443 /DNA_START=304 /DNA_END=777 /DNA_ORIENTATION=+